MKLLKTFAVGLLAAAVPSMASAATTPIVAHLTNPTTTLNCENLSKLVSGNGNSLFNGAPAVLVAPEPSAYALGICAMLLFLVLKRRRAIKAKLLS
jgi:hypothetical protein